MPIAALLAMLVPLIIRVIDHMTPADAEELRQKLNAAVNRRKDAVARNEAMDAPQDQ